MTETPIFNRLALIGAGLIGSSIARAARAQGAARTIVATARSAATRQRIAELGLADQVVETNAAAVAGADLVIVCIPVGACAQVAAEIGPHLAAGAVISDVGSVKTSVLKDMAPHLPADVHFVPAHPVAGTENSGPDSGFAELFVNRWCILTPPPDADAAAVEKLAAFWRALGANVETMSAEHHDLVLGITSHVPHLIAYTIVGTADELSQVTRSEVLQFSAGGFRDFTRIAASDPTMWRDVFLHNKDAVLEMLGRFNEDLSALTRAIRRGDGDALFEHFTRTRAIRRGIIQIGRIRPRPISAARIRACRSSRRASPLFRRQRVSSFSTAAADAKAGSCPASFRRREPQLHFARAPAFDLRRPAQQRQAKAGERPRLRPRGLPHEQCRHDLLHPRHGHGENAIEASLWAETKLAFCKRDGLTLLQPRIDHLKLPTGRLEGAQMIGERPRIEVTQPAQDGGNLAIRLLREQRAGSACARDLCGKIEHGPFRRGGWIEPQMDLGVIGGGQRLERAGPAAAELKLVEHKGDTLGPVGPAAQAHLREAPVGDEHRAGLIALGGFERPGDLGDDQRRLVDLDQRDKIACFEHQIRFAIEDDRRFRAAHLDAKRKSAGSARGARDHAPKPGLVVDPRCDIAFGRTDADEPEHAPGRREQNQDAVGKKIMRERRGASGGLITPAAIFTAPPARLHAADHPDTRGAITR